MIRTAFISYSHHDEVFARRLHRLLETYRLPGRLTHHRPGQVGRPAKLGSVFRDREELSAGPDLPELVRDAIADSQSLIVVCSPASAASDWVGREIALFRELHGDTGVLAALCSGKAEEVFHPAFREPGPHGHALSPLAADFRREGDGERLALLKLIAPLAGVSLNDLVQRDASRRVRHTLQASGSAFAGLTLAAVLVMFALQARFTADRDHAAGDAIVAFMNGSMRERLKSVGRLDLLEQLSRGALQFYSGKDSRKLPLGDAIRRASLLQQSGGDDIARGDYVEAEAHLREAAVVTGNLLRSSQNNPKLIFAHAQSEYWLGYLYAREGDDSRAETAMTTYSQLAQRLVSIDPSNTDWRLERGYAASNLGTFVLRRTIDTVRAEALFRAAQADFEAAAHERPADQNLQMQVEDGHGWLATTRRFSGDLDGAFAERMVQRHLIERLRSDDPRDYQIRLRLVSSDLALGRIATTRGDLRVAMEHLEAARGGALVLAREDPDNHDVARQLRGIELFEARIWMLTPPPRRPPRRRIEAALGDCKSDAAQAKNQEVAELCELLRARFLSENGNLEAARRIILPLLAGPLSHGERLTEFWLMDLAAEGRGITAGNRPVSRSVGMKQGAGL